MSYRLVMSVDANSRQGDRLTEPHKISKLLAKLKILQSRTQRYISLFNMALLLTLWTEKHDPTLAIVGIFFVILIGLLDWKLIFRAEQQLMFQKNPEWLKQLELIKVRLDIIEKKTLKKVGGISE